MSYTVEERGKVNTLSYRLFFKDADGKFISPFHDIPMYADESRGLFNMAVEVPRWTNAKMEIATREALNPIKQDVKKGKVRYVANVFPHKGYIWNYGAIPQTWEDKLPDGKAESRFAFDGQFRDRDFAVQMIRNAHGFWKALVKSRQTTTAAAKGLNCENTHVSSGESPHHCSEDEAKAVVDKTSPCGSEEPVPPAVHQWFYYESNK